jgi:hypothetical protein
MKQNQMKVSNHMTQLAGRRDVMLFLALIMDKVRGDLI